jgi:hypothetical protein
MGGNTIKPSLANSPVALKVSMASGIKYLGSGFLILASWFLMLLWQVEQQNNFFSVSSSRCIGQ